MKISAVYLLLLLSCVPWAELSSSSETEPNANTQNYCPTDQCNLLKEIGGMQKKLQDMELRLNESEHRLKEIKSKDITVVFSAAAGGTGAIGPFITDTTLIYKTVLTNVGNAYNKATGTFTAPVAGVYYFTYFYHAGGSFRSDLLLYKNEEHVATSSDHKAADGADNGGNGVTLELIVGDQVFVRMVAKTWIWGDAYGHTTFSGFLLSPQGQ